MRIETQANVHIIHSDSHLRNILEGLHQLQKLEEYCDLKLQLSNGDMSVHSLIFIAASPVMHTMYKQSLQHWKENAVCKLLKFDEVPKWVMEKIVTYLYSGSVQFLEVEREKLIEVTDFFGLESLNKEIKSVQSDSLNSLSHDIVPPKKRKLDVKNGKVRSSQKKLKTEPVRDSYINKKETNLKNLNVNEKNIDINIVCIGEQKEDLKLINALETAEVRQAIKEDSGIHLNDTGITDERYVNVAQNMDDSGNDTDSYFEDDMTDKWITSKEQTLPGNKELSEQKEAEFQTSSEVYEKGLKSKSKSKTKKKESLKLRIADKTPHNKKSVVNLHAERTNETYIKDTVLKSKGKSNSKVEDDMNVKQEEKPDDFIKCIRGNTKTNTIPANAKLVTRSKKCSKLASVNSSDLEEIRKEENLIEENDREPVKSEEIAPGNGGECDKCGTSFYFQYELTYHRNKCLGKTNRQRRKCVTCHHQFDTTEEYVDHRNSNTRCIALRQEKLAIRNQKRFEMRRRFSCCACSRKFRRVADQVEHEFLAHEIKYDKEKWPDLYCDFCNYCCMNPWRLRHHKQVSCNKGQQPICDMCGNMYKNEKTLQKHKELMHMGVEPMLPCEECGKTLKGKKGLQHHIRLKHKGENLHNLFMCHVCSKTYRTSSDLTFHLYKFHEQPLPEGFSVFQCPQCDYEHNNKRFFDKHLVLHQDKREWQCEICAKAFKTKNSLNTHKTVHTAERLPCPFEDCSYKALKKGHLKNHIENQHTQKGEKNEKCHLCEYSTFFRGNLIKHQRAVHKLEVVTRYSVQMKAKYKNYKSGQIIGLDKHQSTEKSMGTWRAENADCQMSAIPLPTVTSAINTVSCSADDSFSENQNHFVGERSAYEKNTGVPAAKHLPGAPGHCNDVPTAKHVVDAHKSFTDVPAAKLLTDTHKPFADVQAAKHLPYAHRPFSEDKSGALLPTQTDNMAESFTYTNVPMLPRQTNFPANINVYGIPPLDFSFYNQGPPMD